MSQTKSQVGNRTPELGTKIFRSLFLYYDKQRIEYY